MSEVDPRDARIAQLEGELAEVKQQLAKALATIAELRAQFMSAALQAPVEEAREYVREALNGRVILLFP